jgi:hypothetical protein
MSKKDAAEIKQELLEQAEKRLGRQRVTEIQAEIEAMADQLAILRNTPVELQDEP